MTMLDERPRLIVEEEVVPPPDRTLTLTESQLKAIIADAVREAGAGGSIPPGAYRTETGEVFRDVLEPTGRLRTNKQTGRLEAVNRVVQRRVHLVVDASPDGLRQARRTCQASGLDWYHPRLGWHRGGKREVEVEQNLGNGAALFEMQFEEMPTEDDYGESTVTMQGVAANDPDTRPEAGSAPAPTEQPEPAPAGRRQRGH